MNLIKPKLTAIIKATGVKSPVRWIDLDDNTCCTEAGYVGAVGEFVFRDVHEYDSLRGEFAGRAMQGILSNHSLYEALVEKVTEENAFCPEYGAAVRRRAAELAVAQADALICELERAHDLDFYGIGLKAKEEQFSNIETNGYEQKQI